MNALLGRWQRAKRRVDQKLGHHVEREVLENRLLVRVQSCGGRLAPYLFKHASLQLCVDAERVMRER